MPEGAYPPPFYPDPLLANVNFRPMPGDETYFHGAAEGYETPADLHREGGVTDSSVSAEDDAEPAPDPTEHPEITKPQVERSVSKPLIEATAADGKLRLSAVVGEDEGVQKLVFHVDGKQAAVVDTTGGDVSVDVPVESGEHKVRAFAFTGEKSGPWSETVSVTA